MYLSRVGIFETSHVLNRLHSLDLFKRFLHCFGVKNTLMIAVLANAMQIPTYDDIGESRCNIY